MKLEHNHFIFPIFSDRIRPRHVNVKKWVPTQISKFHQPKVLKEVEAEVVAELEDVVLLHLNPNEVAVEVAVELKILKF